MLMIRNDEIYKQEANEDNKFKKCFCYDTKCVDQKYFFREEINWIKKYLCHE